MGTSTSNMASSAHDDFAANFGLALPRSATVVMPEVAGMDWKRIAADISCSIVFVNRVSEAERLCLQGQPAIAILGVSKGKLAKWLRRRGAKIFDRGSAN